jgi:hypothetical protein
MGGDCGGEFIARKPISDGSVLPSTKRVLLYVFGRLTTPDRQNKKKNSIESPAT